MPRRLLSLALSTFFLAGCLGGSSGSSSSDGSADREGRYSARIVRTEMGIPHITADSFGSLGFGQAYAFAEDNLCVLMEDLVTVRGERARYFGADGSYRIDPNGSVADNVSSDFFWKLVADEAAWQRTRNRTELRFRELVTGWAAGFNRYMAELNAGKHPGRHAACAGKPWLQPISDADLYRRFVRLSVLASSSVFVNEIGNAQPPAGLAASTRAAPGLKRRSQALAAQPGPFGQLREHHRFGSNMYAFGKDGSATGNPIVYGNPHFPWRGTERLYISHNTIPGKIDIMGASLYGVPAVLIGFNDRVAWSHTVSTAYRFTLYELKLNPANPTQYLYDGAMRDMTAVPLKVKVLQSDGTLAEVSRTLYKSHFGPMLTLSAGGVPVLPWSNAVAYTLRDANLENDRLINQFGRWNEAGSLSEFISLHKSVLGVPWVNTVASGPGGKAYYGDVTVVPHVTDAMKQTCTTSALAPVVEQVAPGLPLLDGSRADCEWGTDPDAPAPGIFGGGNLPTLQRDDYVHNCNDSYWLTNPAQPLTGFARIIGDENAQRTLRTRLCILQAERGLAQRGRFDIKRLQDVALGSELLSATLARDAVVSSLCALPGLLGSAGPVTGADKDAACAALAAWDGTGNLASRGSHLWREFWRRASANPGGLPVSLPPRLPLALPTDLSVPGTLWQAAFSRNDPVNTPNTLNVASPTVQQALADAIVAVKASGFAFDAPLSAIQYSAVQKLKRQPVFGGESEAGAFTVISTEASAVDQHLTTEGYGIVFGNSYIQTVTWDADRNPVAAGFITYSQSTDPANPHFQDFTEAYAAKKWQKFPFRASEIRDQRIGEKTVSQ